MGNGMRKEPRTAGGGGRGEEWWLALAGLLLWIVLAGLAAFSSKAPFFDEPWYLNHVGYIHEFGLGRRFLAEYPGYAGPLFPLLHWVLEPITGLRVPWVRLVNVALLGVTILLVGRTVRISGAGGTGSWGVMLLAAPMAWTVGGLALTEVPALVLVQSGILLLWVSWKRSGTIDGGVAVPLVLALAGGVLVSLGIIGRQTYLALLAAPAAVGVFFREHRIPTIAFIVGALVVPALVFGVWGGPEPPFCRALYEERAPLSLHHALLSFGYGSIVMLLISPRWFIGVPVRWVVAVFAAALAANVFLLHREWVPMRGVLSSLLPESLVGMIGVGTVAGLYTVAVVFGATLVHRGFDARKVNPELLFATVAAFLLLLTPIRITHVFGSRYIVPAIPFLILAAAPGLVPSRWAIVRLVLGASLGIASLSGQLYRPSGGDPTWSPRLKVHYPHLMEGFREPPGEGRR